jgi:hypothetical protein
MCYILCTTSPSVCYVASGVQGGLRGVIGLLHGGLGVAPLRIFFSSGNMSHFCLVFSCRLDLHVHCWAVFWHMVFTDGFLFLVKELGLLTYPDHWVRVLDLIGSYMYCNIPNHPG